MKEVRLIDANALLEKAWDDHETCVVDVCDIEDAPTIDFEGLRPHGKWVGEGMDARCNQCGEHPLKDMDGDSVWYWSYKPMFCPNCGAKMDGDE